MVYSLYPTDLYAIQSLWQMLSHKSYGDGMQRASKTQIWAPNIDAKEHNSAGYVNILSYSASIWDIEVLRKHQRVADYWKVRRDRLWEELYGKARTSLFFSSKTSQTFLTKLYKIFRVLDMF